MLSFLFRFFILNTTNVLVFCDFQIKLRNGFVKYSAAMDFYYFIMGLDSYSILIIESKMIKRGCLIQYSSQDQLVWSW